MGDLDDALKGCVAPSPSTGVGRFESGLGRQPMSVSESTGLNWSPSIVGPALFARDMPIAGKTD